MECGIDTVFEEEIPHPDKSGFGMTVYIFLSRVGSRERALPALCYPPSVTKKGAVIPNEVRDLPIL